MKLVQNGTITATSSSRWALRRLAADEVREA